MTSAARVNQIRLLSSVAFENAPKLMLAASCGTAEQDDLAAGCFDRLDRRLGGARHLDRDRRAEGAFRQKADAVARAAQDTSRHELCGVEPALGGELAGIDRLLQAAEIDDLEVLLEDLVVEAALREPAVQRGLAALKTVQRDTGARGLALAAAPGGLALARADAATDPLGAVMRAGIISDLVELHRLTPRLAIPPLHRSRSQASC